MTLRASHRSQLIHLLTIHTTKKRSDHARHLAPQRLVEHSASCCTRGLCQYPSNLTPGPCPRASFSCPHPGPPPVLSNQGARARCSLCRRATAGRPDLPLPADPLSLLACHRMRMSWPQHLGEEVRDGWIQTALAAKRLLAFQ